MVTEGVVSTASRPVARDEHGRFLAGSGRPARRRTGAQLGNLNATRHPWEVFWRKRAVRPADRWILPVLSAYAASLVSDRGGPEVMSAAEGHMVTLAQIARGCTMLVLTEAAQRGGIASRRHGASRKEGAVAQRLDDVDLAAALGRFMQIEVTALRAIGLERRAKPLNPWALLDAPPQDGRSAPSTRPPSTDPAIARQKAAS